MREKSEQLQQTQQGTNATRMTQAQALESIVIAGQAQPSENVQPMDQSNVSQDVQPAEVETAILAVDQDMQDDIAAVMTEATSASEGLPLATLVRPARTLQIEEVDAPIAKHSEKVTLRGVTEFSLEVEARRGLITQRLGQSPNTVRASSYLTEHAYNTAQSQFVLAKQRNFVTLNQPKFEGDWIQAPMQLKMKLWTTSGQWLARDSHYECSRRWRL